MSERIFIVDDERTIRLTFRTALETDGYLVEEAACADEAMMGFKTERYALVILDLRLGEDSGLNILERMRALGVQTPTLMITAYGSIRDAVRAMKLGAIDFLEKPIDPAALRRLAAEIITRHNADLTDNAPITFDSLLQSAKRLVNLREFAAAQHKLSAALQLNDHSADAHNLQGVLHEIHEDYDGARRAYGRAIELDPNSEAAQQNMRRVYELFNFGSSQEAVHLGLVS